MFLCTLVSLFQCFFVSVFLCFFVSLLLCFLAYCFAVSHVSFVSFCIFFSWFVSFSATLILCLNLSIIENYKMVFTFSSDVLRKIKIREKVFYSALIL